jgi:hypothetical protein
MTIPSKVVFVDAELEKAFNSLGENDPVKKALVKAIENIREDFQAGEYIPKSDIPENYLKKYGINNIRVYDLPFAWRLMYTVSGSNEIGIISVLLDWMNHKDYEKLFGI